jgi:hypothetical protein
MTEPTTTQVRDTAQADLPVPSATTREPLPVPTASINPATDREPSRPASGLSTTAETDAQSRFTEFVHVYIREYIRAADQKATFFFAGSTALLAFLYRSNVSGHWMKPIMDWNILDVVSFVAMTALAAGALAAVLVVIPRTPGSRRGLVFWEAIAEYSAARDYADDVATLSAATISQAKAEHSFDLAKVCRRKYRALRIALWICAVGLFASSLVFLFVR